MTSRPEQVGAVQQGKEAMLQHTPPAGLAVVDRRRRRQEAARLNCISHLLTQIPYSEVAASAGYPAAAGPQREYHRGPIRPTCTCRRSFDRRAGVAELSSLESRDP